MHDYFARLGLDVQAARGRPNIVGGLRAAAEEGAQLQHFITNVVIELRGEVADVESYLLVNASQGDHSFLTGAVWEDQLVRTTDGWRVIHRYLRFVWDQGSTDALFPSVEAAAEAME
jgi:hypothetical protein